MGSSIEIRHGIEAAHRLDAAILYDAAFVRKLAVMVPDARYRQPLLAKAAHLDRALAAYDGGALVGILGFHHAGRSFTSGLSARVLLEALGLAGGLRACAVGALLQRQPRPHELLMDGVAVSERARGRGVGSRLLAAIQEFARREGYAAVRLEVVDSNGRARALYERLGFVAAATTRTFALTAAMGFSAVTTMRYPVSA